MIVDKDYDSRLEFLFRLYHNKHRVGNQIISRAFGYSNEDLKTIFEQLSVEGKSVATVGSSGDQALNAIYYGAKSVTLIDGCQFAEPITRLKIAAIKNLDLQEFLKYWTTGKILDHKTYAKISHDLDENTKMFFDTIMLENCEDSMIELDLIIIPYWANKYYRGSEFFIDESKYELLKTKLAQANIEYVCADLSEFSTKLGKYDRILLSNIYDYVDSNDFFKVIKDLRKNNLKMNGKMQMYYDLQCYKHDMFFEEFTKKNIKSKCIQTPCRGLSHLDTDPKIEAQVQEKLDMYNNPTTLIDRLKNHIRQKDKMEHFKSGIEYTTTYIMEK